MWTNCYKCGTMTNDHELNHLRLNMCRDCYLERKLEEGKYTKEYLIKELDEY